MTWIELAQQYFPQAPNAELDMILWEYTGFPAFWDIGADGYNPTQCCCKQLLHAYRLLDP